MNLWCLFLCLYANLFVCRPIHIHVFYIDAKSGLLTNFSLFYRWAADLHVMAKLYIQLNVSEQLFDILAFVK
jgi:hypothetical protein